MKIELRAVAITIGVISVAIIALLLQGNISGDWNTVGKGVADLSVALAILGIMLSGLAIYLRRR